MKVCVLAGDYWHCEEGIKSALLTAMAGRGVEFAFITPNELQNSLAEPPDVFILYKENRLNPMDDEVITWMGESEMDAIDKYVKEGGGWLALHTGMAEYPELSKYIRMLNGRFLYHPEKMAIVSYKGLDREFSFLDEHYFTECRETETEIFLRSASIYGEAAAGWAHPFGKGRVCCLTLAHTVDGMRNSEFVDLLIEKIAWCAGAQASKLAHRESTGSRKPEGRQFHEIQKSGEYGHQGFRSRIWGLAAGKFQGLERDGG